MSQMGLLLHEAGVDNVNQRMRPFLVVIEILSVALCANMSSTDETSQTPAQRCHLHLMRVQYRYLPHAEGNEEADRDECGCSNDHGGS